MRSNGIFFLEYNATDNMEQSQSNIYKHRETSFRTRKTEQITFVALEGIGSKDTVAGGRVPMQGALLLVVVVVEKNVSLDHTRNCIDT